MAFKKRAISFFTILLLLTNFSLTLYAEAETDDRAQRVKAVFLYNFISMVDWPDHQQSGDFIIAVYGGGSMYEQVNNLTQSRSVGSRQINTMSIDNVSDINNCHILFVPSGHSGSLENIVNHLKSNRISALVVSDSRRAIQNGAVINFVIQQGRQRFEISQDNAESFGLALGGDILRLGIAAE